MTLHAGDRIYPIDQMFTKGEARIDLRKITGLTFNRYGTYSIRLYQHEHFMKMTEFTYVPNIESDYTSNITWRPSANKTERVTYKFRRYPDIQMEFDECKVYTDNDNYIVSIPLGVGTVCVKIKYGSDSGSFSTMVELPIRPFEFKIIDSEGNYKESYSGRIVRIDIEEIQDKDLWINLRFLGKYKINNYKIILRSVNGIEQEETLLLTQSGSVNKNLSAFYDTLMTCPLPARIELLRENNYDETITLLGVSDKLQFSKRPIYTSTGYIVISILDKERNLTVSSFNNPELNLHLAYDKSLIGKTGKTRGYKCPIALAEGFYVVEATGEGSMFDFEDENSAWLTNGNDTIYVSNREKDAPIETFSDWIDQLIRDILRAGISNDIKTNVSYRMLGSIDQFKGIDILSYKRCHQVLR